MSQLHDLWCAIYVDSHFSKTFSFAWCEYKHDASVLNFAWTASRSKYICSALYFHECVVYLPGYCRESLKCVLHNEHLYGLSLEWTLVSVSCLTLTNASLDWVRGLSTVWIMLYTESPKSVVYRWLQTLHSNGFSPERLSTNLLSHHLPHSVHL